MKTIQEIEEKFHTFIIDQDHPCVMAQSVFKLHDYHLKTYSSLGTEESAKLIVKDLQHYLDQYDFESHNYETFIAVFPDAEISNELEFEELLWDQLKFIHKMDKSDWDESVSRDPEDSNFSFSICSQAFYIVGMHPKSSRLARRAPYPTLVFNLHAQFEKLREMGAYEKVRDMIRERDIEFEGSINPVLKDFGEESEARQYSGRNVDESWKCPFHPS